MLKESETQLYGNEQYEGFGIDLIEEMASLKGFNYTFIVQDDAKNGQKDPVTGKWSGMIGKLIDGTADLAITDLTITSDREEAVDFTTPFMNLGKLPMHMCGARTCIRSLDMSKLLPMQ